MRKKITASMLILTAATVVGAGTANAAPVDVAGTGSSSPSNNSVYYDNCADARAAGAAPIYQGQPGYRPGLDRDGDGVACER